MGLHQRQKFLEYRRILFLSLGCITQHNAEDPIANVKIDTKFILNYAISKNVLQVKHFITNKNL